jgi:hypothetical protein
MAKSINVSGRMSVERFNGEFQKAFGVRCNVKISKWVNADGKATLASIRPKDFKGPPKVDLSIVGNMTVGTLKKRFEENFGVMIELYIGRKIAPDNVTIGAIREGRAKVSKGEKQKETAPKTTKSDKPDSTQKPSDSDLTEEQIKDFKEQEKETEDSWSYASLANEIIEAGDKDWARKLYQKAEDLAEDSTDYIYIIESVSDEKTLGDKDWAVELSKKSESLAEDIYEHSNLAGSIYDCLEDKDWARDLFKKAEDIGSDDMHGFMSLAEKISWKLEDKDWARKLYEKAEDLAEDPSDYSGLAGSVADEDYLDDKKWARELYDKALDSDGSFDDFKGLCTDYLDDKSIFDEEYFEKAFEKALGLKSSADEYNINSFADSLKEAGETDKLEKLKESLNIEIGITHNIEINGDSIFRCRFDIDWNYYEEQTGDEGPETFEFDYDFKKGVIVNYNYNNAELDCVRIPDEDEAEISSCWYLGQSGEYMNDDYISMQHNGINDVGGEHAAEMEEIVKTINPKVFKELASAALNRIKGLEGIN